MFQRTAPQVDHHLLTKLITKNIETFYASNINIQPKLAIYISRMKLHPDRRVHKRFHEFHYFSFTFFPHFLCNYSLGSTRGCFQIIPICLVPPRTGGLWLYIIKLHIPRNFRHVRLFSLSVAEESWLGLPSVPFSLSLVRFTPPAHRMTCATKTRLTLRPNTAAMICKDGEKKGRKKKKNI